MSDEPRLVADVPLAELRAELEVWEAERRGILLGIEDIARKAASTPRWVVSGLSDEQLDELAAQPGSSMRVLPAVEGPRLTAAAGAPPGVLAALVAVNARIADLRAAIRERDRAESNDDLTPMLRADRVV